MNHLAHCQSSSTIILVSLRGGIRGIFFYFHLSLSQFYHEATMLGMMKVFFLANIIIIMDSSYIQWLVHRRHYKDPTPSIFTLFRKIIGIV